MFFGNIYDPTLSHVVNLWQLIGWRSYGV